MATSSGMKSDLRRDLKQLYAPPRTPVLVDVPRLTFLLADGRGDPDSSAAYREAVAALYAVSYALKFALKRSPEGLEYAVMPREGLWWADDAAAFSTERRAPWRWTMMVAQPDAVTPDRFARVVAEVARKKDLPALAHLRLEAFTEGRCAQVLHLGPYGAEGPTIAALHAFIRAGPHVRRQTAGAPRDLSA
jgi:hypothetical protein